MHRRSLLAAVLLLAGLSPSARAQGTAPVGALTVTWGEDDNAARTYDPRVTQSRHESQVIVQVFDTLIASDWDSSLHPGLATRWTTAPDGQSLTPQLRSDVTFHDGTRFDAKAVKFTFDTVADPKTGSQAAVDILGPYAGCDVLASDQVRINDSQPNGAAVASLSQNELSIVSPTAVRRLGDAGFARAPVGTGPVRFVSWEPGRQVVLERNDAYRWAPPFITCQGPSRVARVVHRFIPDASTRVAALDEAGWKPGPGGIRMKDGTPLAADYFAPSPPAPDTAVAIQAEARRVGFDLRVETITFARNSELVFANAYDILPLRWISADPSLLEIPFHRRNIPRPGYDTFNWPRVTDPTLDAFLEKGAGAPDMTERSRLYADAQKRIMESAVWFPVHDQVQTLAWRADKSGYRAARTRWLVKFHDVGSA